MKEKLDDFGIITGLTTIGISMIDILSVINIIGAIFGLLVTIINISFKVYNHFKKADKNEDGKISLQELVDSIKNLNIKDNAKQLKDSVKSLQDNIKELEDVNRDK